MQNIEPNKVIEIKEILKKKQIWFNITNNFKNQEALTCWDASLKRNRLGHNRIPIFSELKTSIGYVNINSEKKYVMLHCRGNQLLSMKKVNNVIGGEYKKLDNSELNVLDLKKGLVNPFIGFRNTNILQIFDESIIEQDFIPYTMMTNASDMRWGIEFIPKQLIKKLENSIVEDIILDETKFSIKKHKIGILTGNSPESGILLWENINEEIRKDFGDLFLGDISFPEVIMESNPEMGLSMELDLRYEIVKEVVENGIKNLCERGATIVCIACNTTQFFSDNLEKICNEYNAKYVGMAETTYKYLEKNNINSFDFLGINYVSDFDKWSAFKKLHRNFDVKLPELEDIKKINEIAFEVKKKVVNGRNMNLLENLIDKSTQTDTILIALTELSILFKSKKKNKKKYIDTLAILAEEIGKLFTSDYLAVMKKAQKVKNVEE